MKISKNNSKILHASSVEIDGKGVVILGKSGSGKSNLAIKLISMGAKLISDDQTYFKLKDNKIIISKPKTTPNFIEARGIGLIKTPMVMSAKLFCFVNITNIELERLPYEEKKYCFGKKIKMIGFNPTYNNESALFLSLRYGVKNNSI
jgi:HPr kinase/phosphorylase